GDVAAHPAVELDLLGRRQAADRPGDRHQLAFVPEREGVVDIVAGTLAGTSLRVDQNRFDRVRVRLRRRGGWRYVESSECRTTDGDGARSLHLSRRHRRPESAAGEAVPEQTLVGGQLAPGGDQQRAPV